MLFTYVDTEGPRSKGSRKVLGTYSADDKESYFAAATRHQVPDSELDGRQSKVRNRLTRERTSKSMHVCLATDVNTKAPDQQEKAMEHLLCTLHLYSDGMLEVSPDFSALLEEPGKGLITIEQSPALGLFTSDHTTAVALKRGLRLGTHTLRSSSGSDFEYTIENLNGVAIPSEIEELEKRIQASDVARSLKLRGPRGPEGNWLQDPPKDTFTYTMTMNVEIVSAKGFDGNELFISYEASDFYRLCMLNLFF